MRSSNQKQLAKHTAEFNSTLAKTLAPEEVRARDFVTVFHRIAELPSFLWCADASTLSVHDLVRIQFISEGAGIPLKVKSICLPFVLVKHPRGFKRTVDLRQCRLARLDRGFATMAWKAFKKRYRTKRK